MRSRTFLHVSVGILALALAYHLGARTATAQAPGNPIVSMIKADCCPDVVAVTANGDVYRKDCIACTNWRFEQNIFSSAPTPTSSHESFGSLKARYRGEVEPQGVRPSTKR